MGALREGWLAGMVRCREREAEEEGRRRRRRRPEWYASIIIHSNTPKSGDRDIVNRGHGWMDGWVAFGRERQTIRLGRTVGHFPRWISQVHGGRGSLVSG